MATLMLHPQHCIKDPFHHETLPSSSSSLKPSKNSPRRIHRSGDRRKRSPSYDSSDSGRSSDSSGRSVVKPPMKKLVMGEVKILKRGDPIDVDPTAVKLRSKEKLKNLGDPTAVKLRSKEKLKNFGEGGDLDLFSKSRLGPEPEMIPKEVRLTDCRSVIDVEKFAGCGFVTSPSPDLVPIPVFLPHIIATRSSRILPNMTEDIRRMLNL